MTPRLEEAATLLRAGAVIAHPTDTVMGLAVAGRLPLALERLAAVKGREGEQPFLGLIDEPGRLDGLVHSVPRYVAALVASHWPGPLTLILQARPGVALRAPDGSVALRCPRHALSRWLIREAAGLLASTSANRSGGAVAPDAAAVRALFGDDPEGGVAIVLNAADAADAEEAARTSGAAPAGAGAPRVGAPGLPSTLLDCRGPAPRIVRAGALSAADLGLG